MSEQLLKLEHITMQFGGVVAVDDLNLEINRGEIGPYRPQRRWQDHGVQRYHRRVSAHQRRGVVRRGKNHRKSPAGQNEKGV